MGIDRCGIPADFYSHHQDQERNVHYRCGGQDAVPESEGEGERDQLDEAHELELDGSGADCQIGQDRSGDQEAGSGAPAICSRTRGKAGTR